MKRRHLALLAILALGLTLRLHGLGGQNLWDDEAYVVSAAKQNMPSMLAELQSSDANPPLHAIILHLWIPLFGSSEFAVRLPSLISGVLSILAIYCVGCRLFSPAEGLAAAILLAVSPFNIAYSQEARGYSLMMLLTLSSMYFYLRLLEACSPRHAVLYLASTALLLYTHPYGLFIVLAQNTHMAVVSAARGSRLPTRGWLALQAALFVASVPALLGMIQSYSSGNDNTSWLQKPEPTAIKQTALYFSGLKYWSPQSPLILAWATALFLSLQGTDSRPEAGGRQGILLAWLWMLAPTLLPYVISQAAPIYFERYTLGASAAFILLASKGAANLNGKAGRAALAALAAISLLGVGGCYVNPTKERLREAVTYVDSNAGPGDLIAFNECFRKTAYGYYSTTKTASNNRVCLGGDDSGADISGYPKIWVVTSDKKASDERLGKKSGSLPTPQESRTFGYIMVESYRPPKEAEACIEPRI